MISVKLILKSLANLYVTIGAALFAFIVQQVIILYYTIDNIIPSGFAKSVSLHRGKLTLDGTRTMKLWEVPVSPVGLIIGSILGSLLIIIIGFLFSNKSLKSLGFNGFKIKSIVPFMIGFIVFAVFSHIIEVFYPAFRSDGMNTTLLLGMSNPIVLFLGFAVFIPFFEECLFRGWIQGRIETTFGTTIGVIVPSLAFTLIHVQYNLNILSLLFIFSLLLGWMRHSSKSIWPGIVIHCINNSAAILLAYYAA